MNDIGKLKALCISVLSEDGSSFRDLMDFVDDFVSSDLVYDLGGDLQKAVLVLQEDLARFNPSHPDMPHPGFLSAKQVSKSIRLFLNE